VTDAEAFRFVAGYYGRRAADVKVLGAGEWSRAYAFILDGREAVIRFGDHAGDFLKDQAMAGFERWKERHADIVAFLEPADVLVDGMRGRSAVWYRVRVNLIHVPEADRPAQEALDPDYDPWAGYEWPDRAGQLERAPRKKPTAG